MRGAATTALEVAGIGAAAFGFWLIAPALGLIVAGVGLIFVGWSLE